MKNWLHNISLPIIWMLLCSQMTLADTAASSIQPLESEYTRQLVGLFVDGNELPGLIAIHDGNEYLLPLVTILEQIGATLDESGRGGQPAALRVDTPGGAVVLQPDDLRMVDSQIMVRESALAARLLVKVTFDQGSFALHLVLPWTVPGTRERQAASMPEAEFAPPSVSLRNLRADLFAYSNAAGNGISGDYFAAGNLAGGSWQGFVQQDSDRQVTPTDYYWTREFGNSQALIGNSDFSLHPLLPTVEQTGVQYLYSTAPLPSSGEVDITRANSTRRMANGVRTIAGNSVPGSIAELRVDGDAVARTRVRLDGSYDFPNIELPTRGYSEVQVLILDHNTGALIAIDDFSRRSGIELLGAAQHTVLTAVGQSGNLLDQRVTQTAITTAAQWRYGLTEDITVELGRQQVGNTAGNEAAVAMAISSRWFASLGLANTPERNAISFDLEGGAEHWSFDFTAQETFLESADDSIDGPVPTHQWSRAMNLRWQLSDSFSLGLVGRDTNTAHESNRFVLPTLSWTNRRNFSVSARPNYAGNYRVDSRLAFGRRDTLRYAYENNNHLLDYRRQTRTGQEYYASASLDEDNDARFEMGSVSYFDNERFGQLKLGLIGGANDIGYALEWEARFLPGLNSQLRLSKGGLEHALPGQDEDLSLQWQVTLDFAVAQNRIVPADSDRGSLTSAALTGNLMVGGKPLSRDYDIERIELLIDGDTHTARVQGGRYYIEGLQPGLHKVSIDARFLPMELSPTPGQSYWVRLEKSAATEVPLALEVKYAIAGRVRDDKGTNLQGERLIVLNEQFKPVAETFTDQFGLYRADNLSPGDYYVIVDRSGESVASRELTVSDGFLFDQDLQIATGK